MDILFSSKDRNIGDDIADFGQWVNIAGLGLTFVPHPLTKLIGAGLGIVGSGINHGARYINSREGLGSALSQFGVDTGLSAVSIVNPSASASKFAKFTKPGEKILETFGKVGKEGKLGSLKYYGATTGAGLLGNYVIPGISTDNRNPIGGVINQMRSDFENIDDPNSWGRIAKTVAVPLFLRRGRLPGAVVTTAAPAAEAASTAAPVAATEAAATTTSAAPAAGTSEAIAEAAAEWAANPEIMSLVGPAAITAMTAKANNNNKKKQKPQTVTGTYTGRPKDEEQRKRSVGDLRRWKNQQTKTVNTTTGGYTGLPTDTKPSLIYVKRNGGEILRNLRK